MSKPLAIDDADNSDWLRVRTWDIPQVKDLATYAMWRGIAMHDDAALRQQLTKDMGLPFWRPAPKRLKQEVEAFLSTGSKALDNMYLEARQRIIAERIIVEAEIDRLMKAERLSHWASHPNHELHDRLVAYYAPKIRVAMRNGVSGVSTALRAAKSAYDAEIAVTKKATSTDIASADIAKQVADSAVQSHVVVDSKAAEKTVRALWTDSAIAGTKSTLQKLGSGARLGNLMGGSEQALDWSTWQPGWAEAADLARFGGLSDLLDQAGVTINGVFGTALDRIANAIADGIAAGLPVTDIATNISGIAGDNADMIANTETARVMNAANVDEYGANGVAEYEWLAEEDNRTCDVCQSQDGKTFPIDPGVDMAPDTSGGETSDNPDIPPAHPNCRCVTLPVIDFPGTSREDLAPQGDGEAYVWDDSTQSWQLPSDMGA